MLTEHIIIRHDYIVKSTFKPSVKVKFKRTQLSDSVGSELKTLHTAYKSLKEQGGQYRGETDGSYERGELAPLLSALGKSQSWDEKLVFSFTEF